MELNPNVVARAKKYMDALAEGIDPLSGEVIPEGEVVRQERLMKCFSYTSNILGEVLKSTCKSNYVKEEPFQPHLLDYSRFSFSETPIGITEIVKRINACRPESMQKLKRDSVVQWLVEQEYLKRVEIDRRLYLRLGNKSAEIGLTQETRIGKDEKTFIVVVYPKMAQKFILEHLEQIVPMHAYTKKRERANRGKRWTADDDLMLKSLLQAGATIQDITEKLDRTQRGVEMRIEKMELDVLAKREYKSLDRNRLEQLGKELMKK